nr:hypothetical protein CFP56_04585 [Quercus suber]
MRTADRPWAVAQQPSHRLWIRTPGAPNAVKLGRSPACMAGNPARNLDGSWPPRPLPCLPHARIGSERLAPSTIAPDVAVRGSPVTRALRSTGMAMGDYGFAVGERGNPSPASAALQDQRPSESTCARSSCCHACFRPASVAWDSRNASGSSRNMRRDQEHCWMQRCRGRIE